MPPGTTWVTMSVWAFGPLCVLQHRIDAALANAPTIGRTWWRPASTSARGSRPRSEYVHDVEVMIFCLDTGVGADTIVVFTPRFVA